MASVGGEIMAFACEDAEVGKERTVVIGTVAGHIVYVLLGPGSG